MTIQEANQQLIVKLHRNYDGREAIAIADLVMEKITGWKKIDRIINKQSPLSSVQAALLDKYSFELSLNKPVQYVLQEAWFCGMKLYVDENVLIPRPETEELVSWVIANIGNRASDVISILDIGSGSGCIPIALNKKLPAATIYSCDISSGALGVAITNAAANQADVNFMELDFLDPAQRNKLAVADIIVSNPPYIPLRDKETMHANVLDFEPQTALFVPDNNSTVFYEAIVDFADEKLKEGGSIYLEIHEALASQVSALFSGSGFTRIDLKKDMQGKDRMLRVRKTN